MSAVRKSAKLSVKSLTQYLSSYPSDKPIALPAAIERLKFSVANTGSKSQQSHRFLGKTYLPENLDEKELIQRPLRHLAYNNVNVPFEFALRKDNRPTEETKASKESAKTLDPYWTREFVDIWTEGSSSPIRLDITRQPQSKIVELLTSFDASTSSSLPSVPLEEGPELDAYVVARNASDLATYKASSEWKTPEQLMAHREHTKLTVEKTKAEAAVKEAADEADKQGPYAALPLFGTSKVGSKLGENVQRTFNSGVEKVEETLESVKEDLQEMVGSIEKQESKP
ncbi:hypothetical protein [Phaffia rhodozyma]|uniref:Uncharacterized protein n=1 Tax=Phaffia rhodozyma TaxID=264483 RepID=A0A0F7STK5_PHARH|nr:hypothetical protein [Phaffia rhodozyma]